MNPMNQMDDPALLQKQSIMASNQPSMTINQPSSMVSNQSNVMLGPSTTQQYPQLLSQLMSLSNQHWLAQALYTICEAGIPNVLGQQGSLTTLQIMQQIPQIQNRNRLEQILRFLAQHGVLLETNRNGAASFELTPMSQLLRTDVLNQPRLGSLFNMHHQMYWNSLSYMPNSIYQKNDDGLLSLANNGKSVNYLFGHNKLLAQQYQDMAASIALDTVPHLLNVFQAGWAELDQRQGTLLDMGGNQGYVPSAIRKVYPQIRAISYDFPHFIDLNKQKPVDGVEFLAGNFIDRATIPPSDITLIHNPYFNQHDQTLAPMMLALYNRLNVSGKLLHVVNALPEPGQSTQDMLPNFSLNMQAMMLGGKLRTLNEWRQIYQVAGFRMVQIFQLQDALRSYLVICEKV
jgi:hypothetical protein